MLKKGDLVEIIKHDPSAHKKYKVGSLHYVQSTYFNDEYNVGNVRFKGSKKINGERIVNLKHVLLSSYVRKVEKK